jgi:hypothetical protein
LLQSFVPASRLAHEGRNHRRLSKTWKQFAVLVEKVPAPADVIFQNVVEFRALANPLDDPLVVGALEQRLDVVERIGRAAAEDQAKAVHHVAGKERSYPPDS